jgi:hypothetical protein
MSDDQIGEYETLMQSLRRLGSQFGVFESIERAKGDPEEAVRLCPWLGRPSFKPGLRWIDTPLYVAACRRARPGHKETHTEPPEDVRRIAAEWRKQRGEA